MAKKLQGWQKGAGVYSRSYPKLNPDKLLTKHEPTPTRGFTAMSGAPGANFTGRDWTGQFRDILSKVEANSAADKMSTSSLPGGPGGSRGRFQRARRPSIGRAVGSACDADEQEAITGRQARLFEGRS